MASGKATARHAGQIVVHLSTVSAQQARRLRKARLTATVTVTPTSGKTVRITSLVVVR